MQGPSHLPVNLVGGVADAREDADGQIISPLRRVRGGRGLREQRGRTRRQRRGETRRRHAARRRSTRVIGSQGNPRSPAATTTAVSGGHRCSSFCSLASFFFSSALSLRLVYLPRIHGLGCFFLSGKVSVRVFCFIFLRHMTSPSDVHRALHSVECKKIVVC